MHQRRAAVAEVHDARAVQGVAEKVAARKLGEPRGRQHHHLRDVAAQQRGEDGGQLRDERLPHGALHEAAPRAGGGRRRGQRAQRGGQLVRKKRHGRHARVEGHALALAVGVQRLHQGARARGREHSGARQEPARAALRERCRGGGRGLVLRGCRLVSIISTLGLLCFRTSGRILDRW